MRIIAGSARGRKFDAPEGESTRPTLDRVKEAVFGILQFRIRDATVLDLFSGSGNLGLEAASRGALGVVCNDYDRSCAALIKKNAELLHLDRQIRVLCMDYREAIKRLAAEGTQFDIAFLDAPYAQGASSDAAAMLFSEGLIRDNGVVVIEHKRELAPSVDAAICRVTDVRHYGYVGITFLERAE